MFLAYIVRNNKQLFKKFFISSIIAIIAYVPWIPLFFMQLDGIRDYFWIGSISPTHVVNYFFYIFAQGDHSFMDTFETLLLNPKHILAIILFVLIVISVYEYTRKNRCSFPLYGLITFVLIPIVGIILSALIRPIFIERYLVPSFGIFFLSIAIIISRNYKNKKLFFAVIALVLISGVVAGAHFYNVQQDDYASTISSSGNVIFIDNPELDSFFLPVNELRIYESDISSHIKYDVINDNLSGNVYYIDSLENNYTNCVDGGIEMSPVNVREYPVYKIEKINDAG